MLLRSKRMLDAIKEDSALSTPRTGRSPRKTPLIVRPPCGDSPSPGNNTITINFGNCDRAVVLKISKDSVIASPCCSHCNHDSELQDQTSASARTSSGNSRKSHAGIQRREEANESFALSDQDEVIGNLSLSYPRLIAECSASPDDLNIGTSFHVQQVDSIGGDGGMETNAADKQGTSCCNRHRRRGVVNDDQLDRIVLSQKDRISIDFGETLEHSTEMAENTRVHLSDDSDPKRSLTNSSPPRQNSTPKKGNTPGDLNNLSFTSEYDSSSPQFKSILFPATVGKKVLTLSDVYTSEEEAENHKEKSAVGENRETNPSGHLSQNSSDSKEEGHAVGNQKEVSLLNSSENSSDSERERNPEITNKKRTVVTRRENLSKNSSGSEEEVDSATNNKKTIVNSSKTSPESKKEVYSASNSMKAPVVNTSESSSVVPDLAKTNMRPSVVVKKMNLSQNSTAAEKLLNLENLQEKSSVPEKKNTTQSDKPLVRRRSLRLRVQKLVATETAQPCRTDTSDEESELYKLVRELSVYTPEKRVDPKKGPKGVMRGEERKSLESYEESSSHQGSDEEARNISCTLEAIPEEACAEAFPCKERHIDVRLTEVSLPNSVQLPDNHKNCKVGEMSERVSEKASQNASTYLEITQDSPVKCFESQTMFALCTKKTGQNRIIVPVDSSKKSNPRQSRKSESDCTSEMSDSDTPATKNSEMPSLNIHNSNIVSSVEEVSKTIPSSDDSEAGVIIEEVQKKRTRLRKKDREKLGKTRVSAKNASSVADSSDTSDDDDNNKARQLTLPVQRAEKLVNTKEMSTVSRYKCSDDSTSSSDEETVNVKVAAATSPRVVRELVSVGDRCQDVIDRLNGIHTDTELTTDSSQQNCLDHLNSSSELTEDESEIKDVKHTLMRIRNDASATGRLKKHRSSLSSCEDSQEGIIVNERSRLPYIPGQEEEVGNGETILRVMSQTNEDSSSNSSSEEEIEVRGKTMDMTPVGNLPRKVAMRNLQVVISKTNEDSSSNSSSEEEIEVRGKTMDMTPVGNLPRKVAMRNLQVVISKTNEDSSSGSSSEEEIEVRGKTMDMTPVGNLPRKVAMRNLQVGISQINEDSSSGSSSEEEIEVRGKSMDMTPVGNSPRKVAMLNVQVGNSETHEDSGSDSSSEEEIELKGKTIEMTPVGGTPRKVDKQTTKDPTKNPNLKSCQNSKSSDSSSDSSEDIELQNMTVALKPVASSHRTLQKNSDHDPICQNKHSSSDSSCGSSDETELPDRNVNMKPVTDLPKKVGQDLIIDSNTKSNSSNSRSSDSSSDSCVEIEPQVKTLNIKPANSPRKAEKQYDSASAGRKIDCSSSENSSDETDVMDRAVGRSPKTVENQDGLIHVDDSSLEEIHILDESVEDSPGKFSNPDPSTIGNPKQDFSAEKLSKSMKRKDNEVELAGEIASEIPMQNLSNKTRAKLKILKKFVKHSPDKNKTETIVSMLTNNTSSPKPHNSPVISKQSEESEVRIARSSNGSSRREVQEVSEVNTVRDGKSRLGSVFSSETTSAEAELKNGDNQTNIILNSEGSVGKDSFMSLLESGVEYNEVRKDRLEASLQIKRIRQKTSVIGDYGGEQNNSSQTTKDATVSSEEEIEILQTTPKKDKKGETNSLRKFADVSVLEVTVNSSKDAASQPEPDISPVGWSQIVDTDRPTPKYSKSKEDKKLKKIKDGGRAADDGNSSYTSVEDVEETSSSVKLKRKEKPTAFRFGTRHYSEDEVSVLFVSEEATGERVAFSSTANTTTEHPVTNQKTNEGRRTHKKQKSAGKWVSAEFENSDYEVLIATRSDKTKVSDSVHTDETLRETGDEDDGNGSGGGRKKHLKMRSRKKLSQDKEICTGLHRINSVELSRPQTKNKRCLSSHPVDSPVREHSRHGEESDSHEHTKQHRKTKKSQIGITNRNVDGNYTDLPTICGVYNTTEKMSEKSLSVAIKKQKRIKNKTDSLISGESDVEVFLSSGKSTPKSGKKTIEKKSLKEGNVEGQDVKKGKKRRSGEMEKNGADVKICSVGEEQTNGDVPESLVPNPSKDLQDERIDEECIKESPVEAETGTEPVISKKKVKGKAQDKKRKAQEQVASAEVRTPKQKKNRSEDQDEPEKKKRHSSGNESQKPKKKKKMLKLLKSHVVEDSVADPKTKTKDAVDALDKEDGGVVNPMATHLPKHFLTDLDKVEKSKTKRKKPIKKWVVEDGLDYIPLDTNTATNFRVVTSQRLAKARLHTPAADLKQRLLYGDHIKRSSTSSLLTSKKKQMAAAKHALKMSQESGC